MYIFFESSNNVWRVIANIVYLLSLSAIAAKFHNKQIILHKMCRFIIFISDLLCIIRERTELFSLEACGLSLLSMYMFTDSAFYVRVLSSQFHTKKKISCPFCFSFAFCVHHLTLSFLVFFL